MATGIRTYSSRHDLNLDMQPSIFHPVKTPLCKGINLIEASAGTGKTYAIAMLVLRFVVEQDITIDQLLVVTFTKAATEELRSRVRQRLADAKRALAGSADEVDSNVANWLENLDMEPELIRRRLDLALLNIDRAGIFTIHGFCQRVLSEHALESGQLFDATLISDLADSSPRMLRLSTPAGLSESSTSAAS